MAAPYRALAPLASKTPFVAAARRFGAQSDVGS
jgi:hypothetical protein